MASNQEEGEEEVDQPAQDDQEDVNGSAQNLDEEAMSHLPPDHV